MRAKAALLSILFCLALVSCWAKQCGRCDRELCKPVEFCAFGLALDECSCCDICTQGLGHPCNSSANEIDTEQPTVGGCGEFLQCSEQDGVCHCMEDEPVCGSDGETYESVCALMAVATQENPLTVLERNPCRNGPVIRNAPKDSARPLGSLLLLDCEATGYPVPTITWELYKQDGSIVPLPSDDASVAVQVRGGPEKNMVSGWAQVMQIGPDHLGIYSCIATNEKGSVKAVAKITLAQEKEEEN